MITPELIAYIEKQQALRVPVAQIKKNLIKAGWARDDVDAAFSQMRMNSIAMKKTSDAPSPQSMPATDFSTVTGAKVSQPSTTTGSVQSQAMQSQMVRKKGRGKIFLVLGILIFLVVAAYVSIQVLDIRLPDQFAKNISDSTISREEVVEPGRQLTEDQQNALDQISVVTGQSLERDGLVSADVRSGYVSLVYKPEDSVEQFIAALQEHILTNGSWEIVMTEIVGASAYELSGPDLHQRLLLQATTTDVSLILTDLPIIVQNNV